MSSTVRAARCFMSWTKAVWDGGWRGHPCPGALSDSRETRRSRKGIPARKGDFGVYQHLLDSFGGVPRTHQRDLSLKLAFTARDSPRKPTRDSCSRVPVQVRVPGTACCEISLVSFGKIVMVPRGRTVLASDVGLIRRRDEYP